MTIKIDVATEGMRNSSTLEPQYNGTHCSKCLGIANAIKAIVARALVTKRETHLSVLFYTPRNLLIQNL